MTSPEIPTWLESQIGFHLRSAGVTEVQTGHVINWRKLPCTIVAQTNYPIRLEIENRADFITKPNQAIIIPPNVRHRITMLSKRPGLSRWAHVLYPLRGGQDLISYFELPIVAENTHAQEIGQFSEKLFQSFWGHDLASVCERRRWGYLLLHTLSKEARWKSGALNTLGGFSRLGLALARIEEQSEYPADNEQLAQLVGLSPSRFRALFRKTTGVSPTAYRLDYMLRRACELLSLGDLPVAEVARRCGWSDPAHFSRLFHKHCGCAPQNYRRQNRKLSTPHLTF